MLKDTKRPNGKIKRVQLIKAFRGGTSSMGKKYKKGDVILHLSSSRSTGETFVLTHAELKSVVKAKVGKWRGPTEWSKGLQERYHKIFLKVYGHALNEMNKCTHTQDEHFELCKKFGAEWNK